jgi:hypothetical protein
MPAWNLIAYPLFLIYKNNCQIMPKPTSDDCLNEPQITVFKKLIEPVDEFVANQSDSLPKHHNQKYEYYDFFMLLVYYFTSEAQSLKLLVNGLLNKGLLANELNLQQVPYSTCSDAFERFLPELFQAVFQHLLQNMPFKKIPELVALGTLYCIDGSLFPVISSMLWADYTSTHKAVKLHLCFELNRMIPVDFLVTAGNFNERKALLEMLAKGVTYIADRGYGAFYLFNAIVKAEAHFIIRIKTNLLFGVEKSLGAKLPASVQYIFREVTDELIRFTNDKHANVYRLVRFYIGSEHFYVLTDRQDLTTFQIIILYAYRWQIELMFRYLKRTMNGIHIIKNTQQGVTIQFYMILIGATLELRLKQETMDMVSAKNSAAETDTQIDQITETLVSSMPEENVASSCQEFIEILGKNVNKYWKIGIHWITALINRLSSPFDEKAIEVLGTT